MSKTMTEVVSDASDKARSGLGTFLKPIATFAFVVGLGTFPLWLGPIRDNWREAQPRAYRDITLIPKICPVLAPMARTVLSDGFISRAEAQELGDRLDDLSHDYSMSVEMDTAKTAIGINGTPVPDSCDNSPEGYKEIGTVMSPLWVK
jgi:hypothetical protein